MNALPALGDAHIAVHEVLDLDACAHTEEGELGKGHLPADNNARDAILLELFDGVLIVRVHHDGGVQGDGNAHLMDKLEHGEVLHENGIRANFVEIRKVVPQCRQFLIADEVVERDIEFDIARVRIINSLFEEFVIEIEVAFVQTHIEMFAAEVDGIRTGCNACGHGVPCAGRCKQFDGFTV